MLKKITIALVVLLALPVAASASVLVDLRNVEDSIFTLIQSRSSVLRLNITSNSTVRLNSSINIITGNNSITAGDDIQSATITTGDINLNLTSNLDVNSLFIDSALEDCGCDNDVEINATSTVDVEIDVITDDEVIEVFNDTVDTNLVENENIDLNTGDNEFNTGGSVSNLSVDTGTVTITSVRDWFIAFRSFLIRR